MVKVLLLIAVEVRMCPSTLSGSHLLPPALQHACLPQFCKLHQDPSLRLSQLIPLPRNYIRGQTATATVAPVVTVGCPGAQGH